jgi:DNA-binding response OmpR family regulator
MTSRSLLLIEPDALTRDLLTQHLAADGWRVNSAASLSQISEARQVSAEVAVVAIPPGIRMTAVDSLLPPGVDTVAMVGGAQTYRELSGELADAGLGAVVIKPFHYRELRVAIKERVRGLAPTHLAEASVIYTESEGDTFAIGRGTNPPAALADLGRKIEAQMAADWPPAADEIVVPEDGEHAEQPCAIDITLTIPSPR